MHNFDSLSCIAYFLAALSQEGLSAISPFFSYFFFSFPI